jgi:DNA-binding transcriptional LysR family regulator
MFDLNLLRILAAVIEQRTITAAAEHLEVTQPAVTHSLNRLRSITQDQLFIKSGRGVAPTRVAEQLYRDTAELIASAEAAVSRLTTFEPTTASATFRIALTDIGHEVFLPPITRRLRELSPRASLEVLPPQLDLVTEQLESGVLDAAVLSTAPSGNRMSEFIHHDEYLCVTPKGMFSHPGPQLPDVRDRPRVAVTHSTGHTLVGRYLPETPPGSVLVSSFGAIPDIVSTTDLIAFAPEVLTRHWTSEWNIDVWQIKEFETRTEVRAYFPRIHKTQASAWFQHVLMEALRGAPLMDS